jgi:hypothetical protein
LSIVEETESEEETKSPNIHFVFPNSKSKPKSETEPEPKRNPVVRVIPITLANGHVSGPGSPGGKGKLVKETAIDEVEDGEVKVEPKEEAESEKKALGRKIGNAGTHMNTDQILANVALDSNANAVNSNSDQKLLNGAPPTTNSPTATANATVTRNSDSNSVVKPEFLPNFQEQEDGYEVVPNDADHLLRESRIDQIGSQAATPLVANSIGVTQPPSKKTSQAILSIGKIFIVCLICVLIALISVAIIAIEVDVDICRKMRRIPEVELFQNELYEPIKYFFYNKFHSPSN